MEALQITESEGRLALSGELIIHDAAEAHKHLVAALDNPEITEIDASGIIEIDTSGVQLLLALARTATQRGRALSITAASEPVASALVAAGLSVEILGSQDDEEPT